MSDPKPTGKPREFYLFTLPGSERLYANELGSTMTADSIHVVEASALATAEAEVQRWIESYEGAFKQAMENGARYCHLKAELEHCNRDRNDTKAELSDVTDKLTKRNIELQDVTAELADGCKSFDEMQKLANESYANGLKQGISEREDALREQADKLAAALESAQKCLDELYPISQQNRDVIVREYGTCHAPVLKSWDDFKTKSGGSANE